MVAIEIDIKSRPYWGAPPSPAESISMPSLELWLHHTAGNQNGIAGMLELRNYALHHPTENYIDIPYNFLISPDGVIFEARGPGKQSGATEGHNPISHAICVMGNYEINPVPPAVINSCARLVAYGYQQGWWKYPRFDGGHKDASNNFTQCPGRFLEEKIPEINALALALLSQDEKPDSTPIQTGGKEVNLMKSKAQLISTKHYGFGQHVGIWDTKMRNLASCQATIHGPSPKIADPKSQDDLWGWTIGATVRAQVRGTKIVVTVSTPNWKPGHPVPLVHVLALSS